MLLANRRNSKRKCLDLENAIRHSLKAFGIKLEVRGRADFDAKVRDAVSPDPVLSGLCEAMLRARASSLSFLCFSDGPLESYARETNPMNSAVSDSWRNLSEALVLTLGDGAHAADVRLAGRVELALAEYLSKEFTPSQTAAFQFAKKFWEQPNDTMEPLRLFHLEELGRQTDSDLREGISLTHAALVNRLVWISLITNTGMSLELGEYILDLARRVGLSPDQVASAFITHVPEFQLISENGDSAR